MNPERSSINPAEWQEERDRLMDNANPNGLIMTRNAYILAERNSRSWWRNSLVGRAVDILRRQPHAQARVNATRTQYDAARDRYIELQARINVNDNREITATTTDARFRQELANQVGALVIKETRDLQNGELQEIRPNRLKNQWNRITHNAAARTAIGLGLNALIGASMLTGVVPLTAALVGTRVVFGAMGIESALAGLSNTNVNTHGGRANQTPAQISVMGIDELRNRIASLAEQRILTNNRTESPLERQLLERYRELIRYQLTQQFENTAAGGANPVVNWKRFTAEEQIQRQRDTEKRTQRRNLAQEAFNLESQGITKHEQAIAKENRIGPNELIAKRAAEAAKNAEIDIRNNIFSADPPGGLLLHNNHKARIEAACEEWFRIRQIRNANTDPAQIPILNTLLDNAKADLQDNTLVNIAAGATVEKFLDAYREKAQLSGEKAAIHADVVRLETEIARINAEADALFEQAGEKRVQSQQARDERTPFIAEIANQQQLNRNQARMVYDILLGTPTPGGVALPPAQLSTRGVVAPGGQMATETSLEAKEHALSAARDWRGRRWAIALLASAVLTELTHPVTETVRYINFPDPIYNTPEFGPDVHSITGYAEDHFMREVLGLDPNKAADFAQFRQLQAIDANISQGINNLVHTFQVNNPDAIFTDKQGIVHPDLFTNNGSNSLISFGELGQGFFRHPVGPFNIDNPLGPGSLNSNILSQFRVARAF